MFITKSIKISLKDYFNKLPPMIYKIIELEFIRTSIYIDKVFQNVIPNFIKE